MQVVFRADASSVIGIGHLMRCLTLADELIIDACETAFICRELPDNLVTLIEERGHRLHNLPPLVEDKQPQWLQDTRQSAQYLEQANGQQTRSLTYRYPDIRVGQIALMLGLIDLMIVFLASVLFQYLWQD